MYGSDRRRPKKELRSNINENKLTIGRSIGRGVLSGSCGVAVVWKERLIMNAENRFSENLDSDKFHVSRKNDSFLIRCCELSNQ